MYTCHVIAKVNHVLDRGTNSWLKGVTCKRASCHCMSTFYRVQQIKDPTTPEAGVRLPWCVTFAAEPTVGDRVAYIFIFALKGLQRPIKFKPNTHWFWISTPTGSVIAKCVSVRNFATLCRCNLAMRDRLYVLVGTQPRVILRLSISLYNWCGGNENLTANRAVSTISFAQQACTYSTTCKWDRLGSQFHTVVPLA